MTTADLVPEVFTCPSGTAERADSAQTLAASPTKENCSYAYLADGLTIDDLRDNKVVLMVEALDDHDRDGVNVLFADGSVDFIPVPRRTEPAWWKQLQADIEAKTRPIRIANAR